MKVLPYLILLAILTLTACQPLRIIDTDQRTQTDSTRIVTHRDTLHITLRDTLTTRTTHHVTVRDTTYTREHIVIRFDRETGQPIERIEDRTVQQYRTLDSLYNRMLSLQHSLDSIRAADSTHLSALHSSLFTYNSTTERGDAARTPWQTFLHYLSQATSIILLTIIIMLILYAAHYARKK